MAEGAASIFGPGSGKTETEDFDRERAQLHAKIGQQAVELDWLTKKSIVTPHAARTIQDRMHKAWNSTSNQLPSMSGFPICFLPARELRERGFPCKVRKQQFVQVQRILAR